MEKWGILMSESFTTVHTIRSIYADTDQMGFVHHAKYLEWFEAARTEMMREKGISYKEMEENGFLMPVLEAHCTFIKPVLYDDIVNIHTGVLELSRAKIKVGYRIYDETNETLHTTGITHHCYMTPSGKPVRAPADIINLLH